MKLATNIDEQISILKKSRLDELKRQLLTEFERPETVSIGETITYIKAVL